MVDWEQVDKGIQNAKSKEAAQAIWEAAYAAHRYAMLQTNLDPAAWAAYIESELENESNPATPLAFLTKMLVEFKTLVLMGARPQVNIRSVPFPGREVMRGITTTMNHIEDARQSAKADARHEVPC